MGQLREGQTADGSNPRNEKRKRVDNKLRVTALYSRIREILESARANVSRSVNTMQVATNWLIGREIVEEQNGQPRAEYGEELLKVLSRQLSREYGRGVSVSALQYMRAFYQAYPGLLEKQHAPRVESQLDFSASNIPHAVRGESSLHSGNVAIPHALRAEFIPATDFQKSDATRRILPVAEPFTQRKAKKP
jgi:hypothetical protein